MLPSETELPLAAVAEIASILAHGYLRYRASLRKVHVAPMLVPKSVSRPRKRPRPRHRTRKQDLRPVHHRAFIHVTVVNARSVGEN